jgi:hypothetical protein
MSSGIARYVGPGGFAVATLIARRMSVPTALELRLCHECLTKLRASDGKSGNAQKPSFASTPVSLCPAVTTIDELSRAAL